MFTKVILNKILVDGVPFRNIFGTLSTEVYCTREAVEVILVETPSEIDMPN